ncbi:NnrS family protein [Janthinobacterium sp. 17J80-10]|uniref:NnrS family protein n=1 Tax=Janthinobacterium sp. 17J80-10 TaxID=2497863 RepID=UPI0010055268|nr:NnrS family protein [Janthinobacterium sp. 17J80-10]QAU35349.1 NnrS family protein [Janthinobacterium sp. 17J80-10]
MSLLTIEEPQPMASHNSLENHPFLALGFRPFYLLAAAFAAVSVPVWLLRYFGYLPQLVHIDLNWHVHEMVFGFAVTVVIGFLFTAGRNWTGLWTPRGRHLALLALLWIAGRIAMLTSPLLAAVIELGFLPLATWPLYRVLKRSGNRRNMFLVVLLGLLTAANAVYHGAANGWLAISSLVPLEAAILVIVMIESVIAGRILPNFTANAVPGVKPVTNPMRDKIIIATTALTCLAWAAQMPPVLVASLALAAAVSQLLRLSGWKSFSTLHNPLLWILHVSYAWIPVGFALLGLAAVGVVTNSAAFHVLAVGSMGGLIIGMITRTTLGHTGRMLKSGRMEKAMYLLVQAGVLARFAAAIDGGAWRNPALVIAAGCWATAFALYLVKYVPYLMAARIDGKEG